jgi:hypothetical protein
MDEYLDTIESVLYQDAELREKFVENLKSVDSLSNVIDSTVDSVTGFKDALDVLTSGTEEEAREVMR